MRLLVFLIAIAAVSLRLTAAGGGSVPGPTAEGRYAKWEADGVMVEVHRSMRLRAPENSLLAAEACYLAGGDAIDCDVRSTLDGVVVCYHDRDPSWRGSGSIYPIGRLTWSEAREVLIEPLGYPHAAQTVAKYEDCLRLAVANNMAIYIDPKEAVVSSRAKGMLRRYGARHLLKWPRWPRVYYWTSRADHDVAEMKRLLGAGEFRDMVRKKDITLAVGDPRSLRVDDPRVLALLTRRDISARGPWRPPVPAVPVKPTQPRKTPAQLRGVLAGGDSAARLAAAEMCARFPAKALGRARKGLADTRTPPASRVECLWMLGELKDASTGALLIEHLTAAEPRVREVAAYALGRMKAGGATEKLLPAVRDSDPTAAAAAAWALWRTGDAKAGGKIVPLLAERLAKYEQGDHLVVRMLLLSAGSLKLTAAVPVIRNHMLAKVQAANANVAIAALGAIGGKKAVALAGRIRKAHGRATDPNVFCRAMAVAGADGTPALLAALAGRDRRLFMDATLTLADVPDAVEAISAFIRNAEPGPAVKARLISALVLHKDPAAKAVCRKLAADADPAVARLAKWALTAR